tara:strand:+ start:558 stop:2813 length:2256 start_codon:yes stop_codon:yes gene_type:complete
MKTIVKNILVLIFPIFLLLINNSFAEKISDFEIKGNKRVNVETIKIFSEVSLGEDLDSNDLNNVLKRLYKTNFFQTVEVKIENSVLIIKVKENPIVQNLIVKGIKNKDTLKEIKELISLKEKNPYIEDQLDAEVRRIKNFIQEGGYYFSDIELLKKENNNNTIDLVFNIDLGDKAYINKIIFTGDKKFKRRKLINVITSEEDKFWKFISSKRLLNKQRLNLDKRLLTNFYKNKGYFEVKVLDNTVQYDTEKNFNIIFNIESGKKFYFSNFELVLPEDFDQNNFLDIEKELKKFSGEKYSLKIVEKMLDNIEKIASRKQYEFVNARIDEKIVDGDKIDVKISIISDKDNFYVKNINIFGNNITIEDVIRNELIIDEGDPLNKILFNKSINSVKGMNIFDNVTSEVVDTDNPNEKSINIRVEEKPTGQISLGAGVGTSGTSTSFGVKENNFLGKAIKLNSNLTLSEESIKGLFSYTKPNYGNSDKDLTLSLQAIETDRLTDFGYKSNDTGFSIGTNFEYLEDLYFAPNVLVNYESLTTSSAASNLLKKQEGSYFDTEVSYSFFYDQRDQTYQPTDGFSTYFFQKLPVNFDENQTIVNGLEYNTYYEYLDNQIFSLSLFAKAANSVGDDDVRISDRLYLPAGKLRGFEAGKIGPIDGGDFVGGNYLSSLNAQANIPVFPGLETFDFNIFYDAANVWGVDYSSSINESNKIRSSTGLGVDWFTPIGPLSFSFAQPLTKKSTDKTESFRFNLGTTF